jgi:hypothetical protein
VGVGVCNGESSLIEALKGRDLVSQLAPNDFHQNNASLFKLARLVKTYENEVGREATNEERAFAFDRWCLISRPFWRHTREEYWTQFLDACFYARTGLDHDAVQVAVSRAKAKPLPEVLNYTDERVRLLAAICRELDVIISPFFVPTRLMGEILGVHYTQAARWLRALEALRHIHLAPGEVRRSGVKRSPRYHYGSRATCLICGKVEALPILPSAHLFALPYREDVKVNPSAESCPNATGQIQNDGL